MKNIGKKNYLPPKTEKIEFRGEDVISTSGFKGNGEDVSSELSDGMKNFNTLS